MPGCGGRSETGKKGRSEDASAYRKIHNGTMSKGSPTLHATTVPILHSGVDRLCGIAFPGWISAIV